MPTVTPTEVYIAKGSPARLQVGDKLTLKAAFAPANAKATLTWSSSDTSVAVVSTKGVVTAKKAGTATITVETANGKTAKIKIIVKKK